MTQPLDSTRPNSPVDQFQYAVNLARAGRKVEARDVLRRVVGSQPVNQAAWLWLSAMTTERAEAEAALAQARRINPLHPSLHPAEQWLAQRFDGQPDQAPTKPTLSLSHLNKQAALPMSAPTKPHQAATLPMTSPQPPVPTSRLPRRLPPVAHLVVLAAVALVAVVGVVVLSLGVTLPVKATTSTPPITAAVPDDLLAARPAALDEAWARSNWTRAITILEGLRQARPNSEAITEQLTEAYLEKGIALRDKGFVIEAKPFFEQALRFNPDQLRAKQEQRLATGYLAGVEHYQAGRWQRAIRALEAVRVEDSSYVHVNDLLYSAYFNHGLALQAASELTQARAAFESAIALRPDLPEPGHYIAEIDSALAAQTLPATPDPAIPVKDKLIIVGIAEQRMWVYEKDKRVFDFIVSTGEPGSDTAIGEFEILDKIDVAYASTWNLDMPYWMGIYWAGATMENGIHSLPIVRHTGYKLWDGYLGQRVSYGCVILGDEDAATLYKWADIGIKVKIVPSLADWSVEAKEKGLN